MYRERVSDFTEEAGIEVNTKKRDISKVMFLYNEHTNIRQHNMYLLE